MIDYGDEVTPDEREAIDAVLGYDDLAERYVAIWVDPVKFGFNTESSSQDLANYLRTWVRQGLKHPDAYFKATWATAAPYLAPGGTIGIHRDTGDVEHDGSPLIWRPSALNGYHDFMMNLYDALAGAPVLRILFQTCLYSFYVPLIGFIVGLKRRSLITVSYGAVAISLIACLITPMFHARYALPLIYTAPLLLCFLFCPKLNRAGSNHEKRPQLKSSIRAADQYAGDPRRIKSAQNTIQAGSPDPAAGRTAGSPPHWNRSYPPA